MQITISGQHAHLDESVKKYITDHLTIHIKKYFDRAISAHVTLKKERMSYHISILVNDGVSKDMILKADGETADIQSAFDIALSKLDEQLRRHKTKIKNHHHHNKQIIDDLEMEIDKKKVQITPDNPVIIAERSDVISTLTVSEAVIEMEKKNMSVMFFINSATGHLNAVYKRSDGNIAWLDPKIEHNIEEEVFFN